MRKFTLVLTLFILLAAVKPAGAVSTSATSAILVDADSGRVLFESNADEVRLIASITKLMTALVAVEQIVDLSATVEVKAEWIRTEGSSIYLKAGEVISYETLLYGLLLESGNDAAQVLACACAGDELSFAELMNEKAEELGMEHSSFANASGLNAEEHYSTARDMAKLAVACLEQDTLAKICATKSITIGERTFVNHNRLLSSYEGCIGMKTGYTQKAGRTLVSAAERDGQRLVAVTLNAPNDWNDHKAMFDYGFETYPAKELALAGETVGTLPVTGSLVRFVPVGTEEGFSYPMKAGETVEAKVESCDYAQAPVRAGEAAGRMVYYLNGEEIGMVELTYQNTVHCDLFPEQTLLQRILSAILDETITVHNPMAGLI